ncbi:ribosome biogenesis protein BMS1 homolog, partial [Diaphorina citri]|uniref:Ribosome biogenesis protein BMS1 homolog n=1 Tax=Diaphorina citri TaxID=121845 RepID=A0A1S3DQ44_DIACI
MQNGMFKVVNLRQRQQLKEKDVMNSEDSSKFILAGSRDWTLPEIKDSIRDCFVTGKWKASEDASELLRLDDMDDDEELFGDFEDLETGEKHSGDKSGGGSGDDKPKTRAELMEKKRKLKEQFDAEYDDKDGGGNTYYDDLKPSFQPQTGLTHWTLDWWFKSKSSHKMYLGELGMIFVMNIVISDMEDGSQGTEETQEDNDDELGGMFKVVNLRQRQQLKEKDVMNSEDSSKFILTGSRDWTLPE